MDNKNGITEELASMGSPLAHMPRTMPYSVPEGYFNDFHISVAHLVAEGKAIPNGGDVFSIPEGYFDLLPVQLIQKIRAEEKQKRRRVIELSAIWQQVRLAAAAVLLLTVGIGTYKFYVDRLPYNTERALSNVPKSSIHDYVQQNIDDFDTEMILDNMSSGNGDELSRKEINDYLNEAEE